MSDDDPAVPAGHLTEETFAILQAALAELPVALAETDSAPAAVLDGARWVLDWINMDAELAALTGDSSVDEGLASVRSSATLRYLSFECGSHQIEIEVQPVAGGVSMTGTVSPVVSGVVRLVVGGAASDAAIDDLGTFVFDTVNRGVVLAHIETDAGPIRLDSFEI